MGICDIWICVLFFQGESGKRECVGSGGVGEVYERLDVDGERVGRRRLQRAELALTAKG